MDTPPLTTTPKVVDNVNAHPVDYVNVTPSHPVDSVNADKLAEKHCPWRLLGPFSSRFSRRAECSRQRITVLCALVALATNGAVIEEAGGEVETTVVETGGPMPGFAWRR